MEVYIDIEVRVRSVFMFSEFQDFHSVEQLHNEGFSDIPNEKGIILF